MALKIVTKHTTEQFLSSKIQSILHVHQALIDAYMCERAQPQWRQNNLFDSIFNLPSSKE